MARLTKTVDIGKGKVIINELTVGQVRSLVADLTKPETLNQPMGQLIKTKLHDLAELVEQGLQLPPDVQLDDLSLSEVKEIWEQFYELHKFYLEPVKKLISQILPTQEMMPIILESLSKQT